MFMECDEIAVESTLWSRVLANEKDAKNELRRFIDGMEIYEHALSTDCPPYTWVNIRELLDAGVLEYIVLKATKIVE